MKGQQQLFSHNRDDWETPERIFNQLNEEFNFTLDPCASESNHKCDRYYTERENGLCQSWAGHTVFVNPPYSKIKGWVEKSEWENEYNRVKVVMLLPARTDTKWFHEFIYSMSRAEIRFLKGRLKFEINGEPVVDKNGKSQSAPFPSMVVIFN